MCPKMNRCSSAGPQLERMRIDVEHLASLLEKKVGEPTWSINSRESTPFIPYEAPLDPALAKFEFWRDMAISFERDLTSMGRLEECRLSIPLTSYWEIEAKHLEKEFWRLQFLGTDQAAAKKTMNDGPVSSRLRNREKIGPRKHVAAQSDQQLLQKQRARGGVVKTQRRSHGNAQAYQRSKTRLKTAKRQC